MRRAIVPLLVISLVVGVIVLEVVTAGSSDNNGQPAPPLPPSVLQPPKVTLAELHGKPSLINFWASWCDPCRKEAPELERLHRSLRGRAHLVGVDYTDRQDAARSFIRQYGWTFPVLSDPDGVYGARYRLSGLPTTAVLDSQGRIVETLRGPQDLSDFRRALSIAGSDASAAQSSTWPGSSGRSRQG
jgi:cytochrome c biogenesis protein CcmG, thiol:disulfide interchange protein DsbE